MSWDQDITARLQRAAASERADERHWPADTMLEAASTIDLLRTQHQGQAEHIIALRAEVDRLAALAPVVAREVARAKGEALREAASIDRATLLRRAYGARKAPLQPEDQWAFGVGVRAGIDAVITSLAARDAEAGGS